MGENLVKQACLFITTVVLCSFIILSAESFSSHQTDNPAHSDSYTVSLDSSEPFSVVISISTAIKFEHPKQLAKWLFVKIYQEQLPDLSSDAYLMTEPITEPWFLFPSISRFRLSGWKDASLQYKIKNTFI
ncbi:hypothetical protein [Paraglaciecola marina]|uniref:hypothetical protein n=1 Tax=Paraglaciecola marina TaxID=2500157 RepID=UPI0010621188|nr:hypothetical protein [Paraglaciecola marina]